MLHWNRPVAFLSIVTADTSIWSSLRNPTYLRLWSALVVSGCCVSAHEMAAMWAMNSLGAPTLWLSLMSSAGTLPFFLFTVPAGALADLAARRRLLRIFNCWLAGSAALLALCSFLGRLTPGIILAGVFLLGTGFAFQAPVASASIPEIVGKEHLPSAIALGGIQMNLAGIVGPAIGGFLLPFVDSFCLGALGGRPTGHTGLDPRPNECHPYDGIAGRYFVSWTYVGGAGDDTGFGVGLVLGQRCGNRWRTDRKTMVDRFPFTGHVQHMGGGRATRSTNHAGRTRAVV
jgi:MFS family permease